ncbi:MAG: hypothetical protein J6X25_01370 [Bacteroidales bacterium]|nr:hypothetical protein [Bacteroidales bacterium]
MKKIIRLFGICAFVALSVSCEKERENTLPAAPESEEMVTLSFTATMDSEMTRAAIDGKNVVWEAGDKIGLFVYNYKVVDDHNLGDPSNFPLYAVGHDNGYRAGFTSTGGPNYKYMSDPLSVGGESATFTFTLSTTDANRVKNADYYVAVFPYREGVDGNEITYYTCYADKAVNTSTYTHAFLRYIFPEEQTNSSVQIAYAYSTNNQLAFQNLNSIIKFNTADATVKTAVLTGNDGETLSNSRLEYTYDSGTYKAYSGATAITSITNTDVQPGDNFFALKPGVTLSNGFTITLYNSSNEEVGRFVYGSSYTTARNRLTNIANFDSRISLVGVQDLSSQMANCLVVSNSNTEYMFPAKNGSLADLTGVDHVSVLWETDNSGYQTTTVSVGDIITDVTYDSADNMIHFRTADNGKQGNALIVAYNSSNSVLWSWHIWRLAGGLKEVTLTTNHGESEQFLDRNLGAVSCNPADGVKTYGLYYQWGCKNPLLGGMSTGNNAIKPVYAYAGTYCPNTKQRFASISSSSLDTYMKNPRYLYYDANEDTGSGLSAYYSPIQYYWQYSTGSVAYDNYQLFAAKGQNDPCPAGYAVSPGASNPRGCNDNGYTRPSESNIGQYCWWVGGVATDNGYLIDGSYFPLTGNINHNFGTIYADAVYLTAYYNQTSFFRFSGSNSGYYPVDNGTETLRTGGVVRCQKIH